MDARSGLPGLPSILIVDDTPEAREMLYLFLTSEGYAVIAATDGLQALRLLRDGLRPSVIVSDLRMPGMDGEELCRTLSQEPTLAGLKVVLISGESCLSEVAAAVGARCLRKPVDLRGLLKLVQQSIRAEAA